MADALGARHIETPLVQISERSPDLAAMYAFLATDGYGIDIAAVRNRYPEVPWTDFADWAPAIRGSKATTRNDLSTPATSNQVSRAAG